MSTLTTTPAQIPRPIRLGLRRLRRGLTFWLLVDGLSRLLVAALLLVALDVLLDRAFRMDFSQRLIMLCVMAGGLVALAYWRVLRPMASRPGDDALILEVEEKNRACGESLISSIQLARETDLQRQGMSPQLVEATIGRGALLAQSLPFGSALDRRALVRNLLLLAVGVLGVAMLAIGISANSFWRTWFNRNILLTSDQWPKNTRLVLVGIDSDQIILPRGEDHKQLVEVDATSRITDVEVNIEVDDASGRVVQKMKPTGRLDGREHQLVFRSVASEFRFRARGGDDVTPWVQVRLVEPPGLDQLQLEARLPQYTGVAAEVLPKGSGPHAVLQGSSLHISARANKLLQSARLVAEGGAWTLDLQRQPELQIVIPSDQLVGGKYAFELVDQSGLQSARPTTFTLKMKPDREPRVRASLLGISGQVVPRAMIPVSFTANDEYAITDAGFHFVWKGNEEGSAEQQGDLQLRQLQDQFGQATLQATEVLDLLPYQIPTGVGLRLSVLVTDNNTLTGPGVGPSREFLLRVVTEEELRADLLRREIEQRQAFELALANQQELTVDLRALSARLREQPAEASDLLQGEIMSMQRGQKIIGTNIAGIADRFEQFLVEAKNNRLDEAEKQLEGVQSIESRLNDRIIVPIRSLDTGEIVLAGQGLEQCRRTAGQPDVLRQAIAETVTLQEVIVERMQQILAAMQDAETYQEVVNKAIEIKRSQENVRKMALDKKQQDREKIFDNDQH